MMPAPLLTDTERQQLAQPARIDVGSYHTGNPLRECAFVVDLLAQPLAALAEGAAAGRRVYEFMSIRRPGDVLRYLRVRLVDVDQDVVERATRRVRRLSSDMHVIDEPTESLGYAYDSELPLIDFDRCFHWDFDDTEPPDAAWLTHREGGFWRAMPLELLALVQSVQARLRQCDDYLLQHELRLMDASRHRRDFLADPLVEDHLRPVSGRGAAAPAELISAVLELIHRDDVRSVSCPFDDFVLWRILIEEQLRRAEASGLPLQSAFGLCGPDSGLPAIPVEDWGGEVHIPYEGACGADLFILPSWHRFLAEKVRDGGKLRYAVGKPCHHVLVPGDYGELACATREVVGKWTLYTSTAPYEECNPLFDPEIERIVNSRRSE